MNVIGFRRPQIVTNARCCADPRAMCWRCAEAARLEEWEDVLPLPGSAVTENVGSPTHPSTTTEHLATPATIGEVVNARLAGSKVVREAGGGRRWRGR